MVFLPHKIMDSPFFLGKQRRGEPLLRFFRGLGSYGGLLALQKAFK
jgi:hypothetical protein